MHRKILVILFLSLSCSLASQSPLADQVNFSNITTENTVRIKGLSQNTIFCILQDNRGLMWFGTWDGLNRYDGYEFTIYNLQNGLSNTTIRSFAEDPDGYLWIGTDDGLNRLDLLTNSITVYKQDPNKSSSIPARVISYIYIDEEGLLWLASPQGLIWFEPGKKVFTMNKFYSRDADSSITNVVNRILPGKNGLVWIGTGYGLIAFDQVKKEFEKFHFGSEVPGSPADYQNNFILSLVAGPQGKVWAGTRNGIFILDPTDGSVARMKPASEGGALSSSHVNALLTDRTGLVWIGTDRYLDLYDPVKDSVIYYHTTGGSSSIGNDDIRSLYQDPSGTVWVGTYKGISKVDENSSRFNHFQLDPDKPGGLSDNIVYSIMEDNRKMIWLATYGGINIFDPEKESFRVLRHDPTNPNSLVSDRLRALIKDSEGFFWFGSETSGLNRYDEQTGKFELFVHDPNDSISLSHNNIYRLMVDREDRLWISTGGGISIRPPGFDGFLHLNHEEGNPNSLVSDLVYMTYEDREGRYWVGTNQGLNMISHDLTQYTLYQHDDEDPSSIRSNLVYSVYEDAEGIIWVGTMGGGLNRLDLHTGAFTAYTEDQGLPNNVVYASLEDKNGFLWLSTNWGLSKFDKKTGAVVNYDSRDGLQGNEFNAGAYYQNSAGEMFFGGMNGFTFFYPASIKLNNRPPRVVITRFKIFNEPLNREVLNGDTILLRYADNFFSFEFSALDYTNPPKNQYKYMLENYDPDWIYKDASQRIADYKKVKPGTYTFRVSGSNNDGIWNPDGISVTLIIVPPWWNTWFFRITSGLVIIALLWWFIYFRLRIIRRKHEFEKKMLGIEKQVFELEQKALRLQMNPHFIFNSLNAIQNFVISNDTDKAVNYLAKFSHLMRMILTNSTESFVPLKDELRSLTYYMDLEKLRFDDKFEYTMEVDPGIDVDFMEIPPMLMQPYVENAIIHGLVHSDKPGKLEIRLRVKRDMLYCSIRDNGIGREAAAKLREQLGIKRQPKGMMITRERLEILKKQARRNFSVKVTDLKDKAGHPAGTEVEIALQYREIST